MPTCLRHTAHPFELCTIEIVGTGYLCTPRVDTLLAFFQIVAVVAAICVERIVVKFDDNTAHTIKKKTVVSDHEKRLVATVEISLEPLYHVKIQMIGRFVEYQQVRFGKQYIGQCHTLLLSSAQLSHRLMQIAYLQLRKHLLCLEHFLVFSTMIETCVQHRFIRIKGRRLLQISNLEIATEYDVSRIVPFLTRYYGQESGFARAVFCYQSYLLSLGNAETDIAEQCQRTKRF